MKRLCKILFKQFICVVLILSLSGCWNSRELNSLAIVSGIGIDASKEEPGKIEITAQLVKPRKAESSQGGSNGSSSEGSFWNVKSTGNTVFSAVRNITAKSSRKLFFPHNEILIFGHDIAEKGIQKYLDFFERDHETRNSVLIAISETSASDLMDVKTELEDVTAKNIADMIEQYSKATSQTQVVSITDFVDSYMSVSSASVVPMLNVIQVGDKKTVELSDTAVFKSDKMVGTLDKTEGRGLLWVLGKVKSGVIVVKDSQGGLVSAEIIHSKAKMTPVLEDGKVVINIKISENGNVGEQSDTENLSDLSAIADLESKISEEIQGEVMAALKKAQELDADIFGFGNAIKAKYPSQWEKMKNDWDEQFKNLEVKLNVDANLRLMGRIAKPLVPE